VSRRKHKQKPKKRRRNKGCTAAEHEQVRQATQIVATELGLTGPPDSPQPDIVMPEPVVEEKSE